MADNPKTTFVILYPNDHNGAFNAVPRLAQMMREQGANVVIIGDGKRVLGLGEVRDQLAAVTGPAMLYIAAHGTNDSWVADHEIYGFTYKGHSPQTLEFLDDRLLAGDNQIASSELFSLVPSNYQAVMQGSCYSAAALDSASRNLPNGTLFFPMASGDDVGYSGWDANLSSLNVIGTRGISAADLFLSTLISDKSGPRLGYAESFMGANGERTYVESTDPNVVNSEVVQTLRRNIPRGVAMGGRGGEGNGVTYEITQYIRELRGHQFSERQIEQIADRLQNVLHITRNDMIIGQDEAAGREANAARADHIIRVRNIAGQITAGTLTESSPEFAYAYAVAYAFGGLVQNNGLSRDMMIGRPQPSTTPDRIETQRRDGTFYRTTKYDRELTGLAEELTQIGATNTRDANGRSVLDRDRDRDGDCDMDDLKAIFRERGVTQSEHIGNRDREITLQEFLDFAGGPNLPRLTGRDDGTPTR